MVDRRKHASAYEVYEAIRIYGPLSRKQLQDLIGRRVKTGMLLGYCGCMRLKIVKNKDNLSEAVFDLTPRMKKIAMQYGSFYNWEESKEKEKERIEKEGIGFKRFF
ncbi:MAG: hypothetical protein ACTSWZ_07715 [Candidatus Heimdallarchaeaceae archaeon]